MNGFNIQYDNQLQNVKGVLSEALYSGYMSDVTLVSNDLKHMSGYKLILAACSPVLRKILVDDSLTQCPECGKLVQHMYYSTLEVET